MYLLSFYFVFIDIPEQLGILNDFFLIINKEIDMFRMVMHHICFYLFYQLLLRHAASSALYFNDMLGIQKDICPDCAIAGILADFSLCQRINGFQIGIQQVLDIVFILDFQP